MAFSYKGKYHETKVYAVKGSTVNNLLGRKAAIALGLVKRVEEIIKAFGEHGTLRQSLSKYGSKREHNLTL